MTHWKVFFAAIFLAMASIAIAAFFIIQKVTPEKEKPKPVEVKPDVKVTLIEGWTIDDMAEYLDKQKVFTSSAFLKALQAVKVEQYPFLESKPKSFDLNGFLFPDTYLLSPDPEPSELIAKMLDTFGKRFLSIAPSVSNGGVYPIHNYDVSLSSKGSGLTLYELITLASIVEKETGRDVSSGTVDQRARLDAERATVAGIFYNRLLIGQALESDATINFITGKSNAASTGEDIKINSPYNTYLYKGLPPGPICNPSLSSIKAVLYPIKTDYFYFLHKQPSGEVVYSKTFDEHIRNKQRYLR